MAVGHTKGARMTGWRKREIANKFQYQTTNNLLTNNWVMRITADRRIEINDGVEVTQAAKKVLEAMQLMLDEQKRTWVGLTEEEAEDIWRSCAMRMPTEFAKALEAKLKEKNT
jgi:hypothetical protein